MLPPWHERIVVGLSPERLSVLSLGGLLRTSLLERHELVLQDQDTAQWDKGLKALATVLAAPVAKERDIAIILSAHYVRHVIFPAGRGLARAERKTLADVVFRDTYGDLARDWELLVSPIDGALQSLACGVPRSLLGALRTVCEGHGRLYSIQPSLMPVFNSMRHEIGRSAGCLALVESGRITLAFVENGHWRYVDSRAGDGGILPLLLLEESELSERKPGGILWLCDLTATARLPDDSFWSHKRIEPPRLPGFEGTSSLAILGLV